MKRRQNYSLKHRLINYNFLVVFVPTFITAVFAALFLLSLMFMAYNDGTMGTVTNARDLVTVFYCQYNVRVIENDVNRNIPDKRLGRSGMSAVKRMEKHGYSVCVTIDEDGLYISEGYDRMYFVELAQMVTGGNNENPQSILYIDNTKTVLGDILHLDDGSVVAVMFESTDDVVQLFPNLLKFLTSISSNEFLLAILLMLLLLAIFAVATVRRTSNALISPINELTKAVRRIREGKLDEPVSYTGIRELSRFYEDFDDMRIQLKSAVDKQKHTDELRNSTYGGLTHDAKTAITAIKGYSQGLMDNVADTEQKRERYIRAIYDSAVALEKLTNSLTDISELESDTLPFNFEKVDMYAYLWDWFDEAKIRLSVYLMNVDITFENHVTEREYCLIDRFQFARVITNIIDNSVKYRRTDIPKSEIAISTDVDKTSSTYVITISDNGKGIRKDECDKIFERFYRSDTARSDVRSGSGVGLSVAYQVVLRHNGSITAEGEPGKGLKIRISLPVVDIGESLKDAGNGQKA